MKSKKMFFSLINSTFLLGLIFIFSECDNSKDIYNPENLQEEAKKAFPVKDVDPNHTWETSAVCNASISVNGKAGEAYTIKIYTANPYNTNKKALLLAKTNVNSNQTANIKFDLPATLQSVYVMKINSAGYSSVIPVAVESGTIKVAFGNTSSTMRAVSTRAIANNFFVPEIPTSNDFPTNPPPNCGNITNYWQNTNTIPYLLKDNTYSDFNPWFGGNFYIQGNVIIDSWNEPNGITNFYLLPNATLTLKVEQFNHRANSVFSIGDGAKLIAKTIKEESGSKCFNRGTIVADKIEITNGYLYNGHTIDTKQILLTNETSKVYNASNAQLSTDNFTIQGNGHFLNESEGIVEVKGTTTIDCINGSWVNSGHYTTAAMNISAWSNNIKNACWLTVNGQLRFTDAGIYNESYIGCKTLYMNNAVVNMGGKAFFEVTEQAEFGYNPSSNNLGFIASTSADKALLKMNRAVRTSGNNNITYNGNLYVACNDHFAQELDSWNIYYELKNGAELSGSDNAELTIPTSDCNPGYNAVPDNGGGDDIIQTYAYAFEDMMSQAGDYDFNDVVLYVSTPVNGKISIILEAAGAAKALKVLFKNNGNIQTIFEDVHTALGVPAGTITNTGRHNATVVTTEITVSSSFSLTDNGDFYISDGKREVHIPKFTAGFQPGQVPYAIRVANAAWRWPKESIKISEAYPDFTNWAEDASEETGWYNNPIIANVM